MKIESGRILGRYYGYPECCINYFLDENQYKTKRHKLSGTGYIPCKKCNELESDVLIINIMKNRIAPTSFPQKENFPLTAITILNSKLFSIEEKKTILDQYNYIRELNLDGKYISENYFPELTFPC